MQNENALKSSTVITMVPRDEQLIERTLYTVSHYMWASDRADAIKKYIVEPDLLKETLDKMLSDTEEGV